MMDSPIKPRLKRVKVTGYPPFTQRQDLAKVFTEFGNVKVERLTQNFAILSFRSEDETSEAIKASDNVNLYGEFLTVKPFFYRAEQNGSQDEDDDGFPKKEFPKTKKKGESMVQPHMLNLSGDFYEQLDNVLLAVRLTQDEVTALSSLYTDVEVILQQAWPGCVAIPFGSITTGLGVKTSDADCYVQVPNEYRHGIANFVYKARNILQKYPEKFDEILAIPKANTPIVKFFHMPTETNCDLTFKTSLGARNSKLIAFLLHADPRLIPLAVVIKYWAKIHGFSGTGKLTNYALTMLLIFYLQQPPVSILPSVEWLQRDPTYDVIVDNWNTGFMHIIERLPKSTNTSSISELLGGFYQYYSTFKFNEDVVCPFLGYPLKKELFRDYNLLPPEMRRYRENVQRRFVYPLRFTRSMCIQDPFELCHNVASPINSRVSSEIIAYFKFAAAAYDADKLNNCNGLLKTILLEKPKLPKPKGNLEYRTVLPHYILSIANPDWKSVVRDVIMTLFEDICKIKLTKLEDNVNLDSNKQKEKYKGVVNKAIWKRRQFAKFYNTIDLTFTEKQRRITEEIIKVDKQEVTVQFQLVLIFSNDVKNAVLFLKQTGVDKEADVDNMFKEFGKFFMMFMSAWFVILLKPYLKNMENGTDEKDNSVREEAGEENSKVNKTVSVDESTANSEDSRLDESSTST